MTTPPLALAAYVFSLALDLLGLGFFVARGRYPVFEQLGIAGTLLFLVSDLALQTMGLLVLSRRRGHVVGWLLAATGLVGALAFTLERYAAFALATEHVGPSGEIAAWAFIWIGSIQIITLAVILPLVFPTGRLPSRRWLPVLWTGMGGGLASAAALALRPGGLFAWPAVENPFGEIVGADVVVAIGSPSAAAVLVALVASPLSLVVRYHTSGPLERQQIKWVAAAVVAISIYLMMAVLVGDPQRNSQTNFGLTLVLTLLPVAAGLAILRYRLYDIDLVIRRTIVYGFVSVVLGTTYVIAAVLLQAILRPFTAGSDLAVAGSTLVVVALFQPIRRRVQDLVDRRFYRSRYDSARTLDAFTVRLRDEVDLDSVRADLLRVIDDTMRPTHSGVWLRGGGRR